ncbi:hypothetical protein PHISCL_08471 [Aspergillus sclerotialis]|uniref:DUF6536 domain-containing protein n=1 Tax=Aspergillus sclerotialis TaxID=2070753 RepID=A0A3A2ZIN3_9EURO|nr:hypothetical protein PHISCL_08471 [Aspergillus sclerotialis]
MAQRSSDTRLFTRASARWLRTRQQASIINILSTIMLGASNYCMQLLAAPSRTEVDEAHEKRTWRTIGIPDIAHLVFHAPAKRRLLGVALLVTSFPIHLLYNLGLSGIL